MKIKFKWENIFYDPERICTSRAKVTGGWLVHHAMRLEEEISTTMVFVHDPLHVWEIDEINIQILPKNILLDFLALSERTKNSLKEVNILNLHDLISSSEFDLMIIPNFGRKSLMEIKVILDKFGLSLAMGNREELK